MNITDIEQYRPRLMSYIFRKVENFEDAEELTNMVCFKAWQALDDYEPSPTATFSTWLYKIAEHEIYSLYRHNNVQRRIPQEKLEEIDDIYPPVSFCPWSHPESHALSNEILQAIHANLKVLSKKERQVFKAICLDGNKGKDVALSLGMHRGQVQCHLHRAKLKMRQRLKHLRRNEV